MDTNDVGVYIEDNRMLIRFRNNFNKLIQKTLGFCTPSGQIEYRHRDNTIMMGKIVEIKGELYIVFPVKR